MPIETGLVNLPWQPLTELESVAVAGESAGLVGEALAPAGGPPLIVEADHFALLSRSADPPAPTKLRDLDQSSVDLVVLRRAWQKVADVAAALRAGARVTRLGGEVLAVDIDVNRLLMGPSPRYPTRLLYLAEPAAALRLESSTASPAGAIPVGEAVDREPWYAVAGTKR